MDRSNKNIKKLISDPSFVAWSLGEADQATADYWDEWISRGQTNRRHAMIAQQIITELEIKPPRVIHNSKFAAWERLDKRIITSGGLSADRKRPSRYKNSSWFYSVAAVAVILIIVMSVVGYWRHHNIQQQSGIDQEPETITISTDFGEQKRIELIDGSQITLNANSSLTYYDGWIYNRKIKVHLEGEALFSVTKRTSPDDPVFQVATEDGEVSVLGTRFVVSTREKQTQVVLEEGTVEVTPSTDKSNEIKIKPDEMVRFDSLGIDIWQVNTRVYTSWAKQLLVFDQTPLSEVTKRIEHTFGVQVMITDKFLEQRKLSGAIESRDLDVMISALAKILDTSISKKGDQLIVGENITPGVPH